MKYIRWNGMDRDVSVIGAGCMRISQMTGAEASAFVHTALDNGINFIDHANVYGGGRSEEVFGALFDAEPGLRNEIVLQTKVGINRGMFDFSKENIVTETEKCLKRLHTDHVESLLLHRPDALMEPDEVQEAFEELHQAGKVLHFGVSNQNRFQMSLLKTGVAFPIIADQVQLSLAHTPMIDAGLNVDMVDDPAIMRDGGTLEYCREKDIAVQAWSPIQYGYFEGTFLGNEKYAELNEKLEEVAAEYGVGTDTIAYAWILRIPGKMQVITGTSKPERLVNAARAADIRLTRRQWYDLYKAAGNRLP